MLLQLHFSISFHVYHSKVDNQLFLSYPCPLVWQMNIGILSSFHPLSLLGSHQLVLLN